VAAKKSKKPPENWEQKACLCCECKTTEASAVDLLEKRSTRKWALQFFWGDLCWWCSRTVFVRYAHLSLSSFTKWLRQSEANLTEARMSAYAYLALREEGRTQITM